ncbi:MAG: glycerol-3-phosphate acyltransferase [Anaerolineae bacterium]|jgi:glycerol-3-phosphate acyltransferase PlsY
MNALVALCAAIVGYLLGSLSFSRIISRLAAPQTDIAHTEVSVPGTDMTYKVTAFGATAISMQLGPRVGCAIGLLDMLKVALPTLAFKLLYPDQPYELLVAVAGMAGHNWPIFHRFKGGRGISAYYGGLFVIDWLGALVTSTAGLLLGLLVIRDFIVAYIAGLWLLIPWIWFRTHRWEYVAYAVTVNVLYVIAMIPDLKQYLSIRKTTDVDPRMVMETNPMGRGMIKISDWLQSLVRRKPKDS